MFNTIANLLRINQKSSYSQLEVCVSPQTEKDSLHMNQTKELKEHTESKPKQHLQSNELLIPRDSSSSNPVRIAGFTSKLGIQINEEEIELFQKLSFLIQNDQTTSENSLLINKDLSNLETFEKLTFKICDDYLNSVLSQVLRRQIPDALRPNISKRKPSAQEVLFIKSLNNINVEHPECMILLLKQNYQCFKNQVFEYKILEAVQKYLTKFDITTNQHLPEYEIETRISSQYADFLNTQEQSLTHERLPIMLSFQDFLPLPSHAELLEMDQYFWNNVIGDQNLDDELELRAKEFPKVHPPHQEEITEEIEPFVEDSLNPQILLYSFTEYSYSFLQTPHLSSIDSIINHEDSLEMMNELIDRLKITRDIGFFSDNEVLEIIESNRLHLLDYFFVKLRQTERAQDSQFVQMARNFLLLKRQGKRYRD